MYKLEVQDLHKRYGSHEVLKGVSLAAKAGDVISIIGSSGSGKSTFLRCINLLEQPHAGKILLNGEELKLIANKDGALKVTKTENGVNPLCFGQKALLGCDVWEHSYYIDFRNKRPAYLSNFLEKLVNWEAVAAKL